MRIVDGVLDLRYCEAIRALIAQDAVVRSKVSGKPLRMRQIRELVKNGRLLFFYSQPDKFPHTCDVAESLAQTKLHASSAGDSSTIRMHAAGTVANSKGLLDSAGCAHGHLRQPTGRHVGPHHAYQRVAWFACQT